jgi:AhpD family alkylhydroperoxidase
MRMNISEAAPEAYKAMLALEKYMAASSLPKSTYDLVKLRASQINGCAYCVDMHSHEAKAGGESDERLYAVAAWREAPYFTPAERAALDFTEAATRLADHGRGISDEVWKAAAAHYDEATMAALVIAVATINSWNRIAIAIGAVAGSHRK